jgi:hypothetical protein
MDQQILSKLKNLDILSKVLFLIIITTISYLILSLTSNLNNKDSQNKLIETAKNKIITLNDYFFESYQINRYAEDKKLYLKTNEPVTQEILDRLEFRLIPEQKIEVALLNENLIEILFLENSPTDLKENILMVLEDNKQLFRITYKNLSLEDSRVEMILFDREE